MESLSEYIRRIAADVDQPAKVVKIQIFFQAGESLTTEADKAKRENFQWMQYSVIFSKGEEFFLFRSQTSPNGEIFKEGTQEVFQTDSKGRDQRPTNMTPDEVVRLFPSILKDGPVLQYDELYKKIKIDESDVEYFDIKGSISGKKRYSVEEFKETFYPKEDESGVLQYYYIVFSTSREKKGPDGKKIGIDHPPEKEVETP